MERLLTPKQLSELLQVKLSTVYYWAHIGFIPVVRLGKCIRFSPRDIERWIIKRRKTGRMRHRICVNEQEENLLEINS